MTLERLVSKYVKVTERIFTEITISNVVSSVDKEKVEGVIEHAKRYLEDSKYYQKKNKLETSLASVSYCEGLLDALRMLGLVKFSWSARK
jgi:FAD synthetase